MNPRQRRIRAVTAVALPLVLAITAVVPLATAQPAGTRVIALEGDSAPDGNGSFSSFSAPVLNDVGQVAFISYLTGTAGGNSDNEGTYVGDGIGGPVQIVREGQAAPNGDGTFFRFYGIPGLNNAGQVVFSGVLNGTNSGSDEEGIFLGDGITGLSQMARDGQAAPGGSGQLAFLLPEATAPALNDAGQVAFLAFIRPQRGDGTDNAGVFFNDGLTGLTNVARVGDPAPDNNGEFRAFTRPALNNAGQAAFRGNLMNTSGTAYTGVGVFRDDGVAGLTRIARAGAAAPDGNGTFTGFGSPALNEAGLTAFSGFLFDTTDGGSDNSGIFLGDGLTGLTQIAREGQAAPDLNGSFGGLTDIFRAISLNNAGQVSFLAELSGTAGGNSDDTGIFLGDAISGLTQVAREGQAAPDGNGSFSDLTFAPSALNDAGQVAFLAELTGTAGGNSDDSAIFTFEEALGLVQVVREGGAYLGSTITGLDFAFSTSSERSGLNESGKIAYGFDLADGRSGVAVWSSPYATDVIFRDGFDGP